MPWQLTTPVAVGDLDSGSYGEAKITHFRQDVNRARFDLQLEYGNTVADVWERGIVPTGKVDHFVVLGTDYADLIADSVPDVQTLDPADAVRYAVAGAVWVERTYYATKRALYNWLSTNGHIDAGTVV